MPTTKLLMKGQNIYWIHCKLTQCDIAYLFTVYSTQALTILGLNGWDESEADVEQDLLNEFPSLRERLKS